MIKAKCIKETYTWESDNEQHQFSKVIKGHVYAFNKIGNTYWLITEASSTNDFADNNGFIDCLGRGLEQKYFNEMFEIS